MLDGVLKQSAMQSVLSSSSVLRPDAGSKKRKLDADLLLTALIDAFSILVIFLLMNFSSTGEILFVTKNMELPKAAKADVLERNPVVKIDQGKISLEGQDLASGEALFHALLEIRQKFSKDRPNEEFPGIVTVQADRRIKYELINQIVVACAQAGFSDMRFAVLFK